MKKAPNPPPSNRPKTPNIPPPPPAKHDSLDIYIASMDIYIASIVRRELEKLLRSADGRKMIRNMR